VSTGNTVAPSKHKYEWLIWPVSQWKYQWCNARTLTRRKALKKKGDKAEEETWKISISVYIYQIIPGCSNSPILFILMVK
jgi:hypothetical protein